MARRLSEEQRQRRRADASLKEVRLPELNGAGLKLAQPCRVCALSQVRPEVLRLIHEDRFAGLSLRKLAAKYADVMIKHCKSSPSRELYRRHFDSHLDGDLAVVVRNARATVEARARPDAEATEADLSEDDDEFDEEAEPPEAELELPPEPLPPVEAAPAALAVIQPTPAALTHPEPVTQRMRDDDSDYFELWELYDKLKPLLEGIYNSAAAELKNGEYNAYDLVLLLKIFGEGRKMLAEANRMKNSDRLMRLVLEAHTKRFVRVLSEPLGQALKNHLLLMRRGELHPDQFEMFLNDQLVHIFQSAATKSLAMSCEEYKLVH